MEWVVSSNITEAISGKMGILQDGVKLRVDKRLKTFEAMKKNCNNRGAVLSPNRKPP